MTIILNKIKFIFLLFLFGFFPLFASAALVPCGPGVGKECTLCDFGQLIQNIINFGIGIAMVLGTAFIIYGGFLIITAGGSPERVQSGRKAIISAIAGIAIVLGAWLIVDTILKLLTGSGSIKIGRAHV